MALFFSQRRPRGFGYKPRYYDPEAERREERKRVVLGADYKSPDSADNYVPGSILRQHVSARRGMSAAENMRKRRRKTIRPVILVGVVVLVILLLMNL